MLAAEEQQVAAADRAIDRAHRILAQELAVHDGDAPVAAHLALMVGQALGDREAVAEIADRAAELDLGRALDAGKAGGAGAGEDALAHALEELVLQPVRLEAEQQDAHAGAPVGRFLGRQLGVDAGLGAAADHRGGEARHHRRRDHRPFRRVVGDDDRGARDVEGFGEGVLDLDAVEGEVAHRFRPITLDIMPDTPRLRTSRCSPGRRHPAPRRCRARRRSGPAGSSRRAFPCPHRPRRRG